MKSEGISLNLKKVNWEANTLPLSYARILQANYSTFRYNKGAKPFLMISHQYYVYPSMSTKYTLERNSLKCCMLAFYKAVCQL